MNARAERGALCALVLSWLSACGSGHSGLGPSGTGGTSAAGTAGGSAGTSATITSDGGAGVMGATDGGTDAGAGDAGAGRADARGDQAVDGGFSPPIAAVAGCSKDGWCWSTPAPQGNPLYSISGSGASDVWAVGEAGSIVHWDGNVWTQVPSGERVVLRGVWAVSPSDAWAVGDDGVALRWNGTAWSRAAGFPTTAVHWRAVWGTGPDDFWLVGLNPLVSTPRGSSGAMLHWDGRAWTPYTDDEPFDALWGPKPDDVWALGEDRGLFHWDGKAWTAVSTGELTQIGTSIWGSSSNDLWLGGRSAARPNHWDGMTITANPDLDTDIDGVWGSGANDVWAVGAAYPDWGDSGIILHWDGFAWDQMPSTGASHLFSVWGSRSDDVWAVGDAGDIVHWNGRAWSAPAAPPHVNLFSVWGSGSDDVWAFGMDRVGLAALHWNGQTWAKTRLLDGATLGGSARASFAPYTAWGSGRDDIWVGAAAFEPIGDTGSSTARSFFLHWDGRSWSLDSPLGASVANDMYLNAMWGSGPKDIWAVGAVSRGATVTGAALHWDGVRWSPMTSLPSANLDHPLNSVWSSGPNDVWIGGGRAVHHWDGDSWSRPLSGPEGINYTVGGSGPTDVWAVKGMDDGTAIASHWNGIAWQDFAVEGLGYPGSVVAISPTNAWLRGDQMVVHWDGKAWTPSDAGTNLLYSNLWWDGKALWTIAMRGLLRHP